MTASQSRASTYRSCKQNHLTYWCVVLSLESSSVQYYVLPCMPYLLTTAAAARLGAVRASHPRRAYAMSRACHRLTCITCHCFCCCGAVPACCNSITPATAPPAGGHAMKPGGDVFPAPSLPAPCTLHPAGSWMTTQWMRTSAAPSGACATALPSPATSTMPSAPSSLRISERGSEGRQHSSAVRRQAAKGVHSSAAR